MKKSGALALAAVMILSALAVSGCGLLKNPMDDANAAVKLANDNLAKASSQSEGIQALAQQLNNVDATPEGAAKALGITAQLRAALEAQKKSLEAAKKALAAVGALEVKPEFKEYAKLESAAIDARVAIVDANLKLYVEMDKMYTAIRDKKTSNTKTQEILGAIDTITNDITGLTAEAQVRADAASKFFEDKKLGGK